MEEQEIGYISNYFSKISVAIVEITKGKLQGGDAIHIKGNTTDFKQDVESMQIEHETVLKAKKGDSIGLKVSKKARKKDKVFKVL
ncbi:MAG: hypothetical protein V3U24_03630 [Candidatus Neomarinimicrobiota bacterium]